MGKLFVLVRKDMPLPYQGVQAGHAVAQWMIENKNHSWLNSTLVYLNVHDLDHLEMWCKKLKSLGSNYSEFIEPDLNNERTSIACYSDGKVFGKLKLMGE